MKISDNTQRKVARLLVATVIGGSLLAGSLVMSPQAIARMVGVPLEIDPQTAIHPGTPLAINIHLTAASAATVTSNPPGMVSFAGNVGANDTINASTSTSASGTVTVYLNTSAGSISTQVPVN